MAVQISETRQAEITAAVEAGRASGGRFEFLAAPSAPHFHTGRTNRINKSKRFVAVEIEVARAEAGNHGVVETVRQWGGAVVTDGSVREGYEINTAPASGDTLVMQLAEICFALEASGSRATVKCGVHTHVDGRDFTCLSLKKLCLLWDKVEEAMFQLVIGRRRTNRYCVPCAHTYTNGLASVTSERTAEEVLSRNVYSGEYDVRRAKKNKYASARYKAMNLHSWFYRGTIEFRLHQGVTDRRKITNWSMLCAAIVDAAKNMTEAEVNALTGSSLHILLQIAPKNIKAWVKSRAKTLSGAVVEPSHTTEA